MQGACPFTYSSDSRLTFFVRKTEAAKVAYKVLYRKYRPSKLADVVGQPQVTETLKNELIAGRVSHAYLFTGSRGTGKTTCAKILAKAVNCLHPVNGDPCCECETCKGIENGSILDVVEIDAASNTGVDSVRSIIEEINFTPSEAKYRVYIIDEVHMLSASAFNALLKTLEEPPEHVIFILATTEVHKLLPTILSRCQRFDFKRITPEAIAGRLEWVCEQENVTISHAAALKIARVADGGMRDALSILDQCLSRSSDVTEETVNETVGIADSSYLFDLAECIRTQNTASALEIIDKLNSNSKDMQRLLEEMADHFRRLMLIKTMPKGDVLKSMVNASESEFAEFEKQAVSVTLATVLHAMDVFRTAMDRMSGGSQRVEAEMAFVRLCSPELDSTSDALIRRIEALEKGMPAGVKAEKSVKAHQSENAESKEKTDVSSKNEETNTSEPVKANAALGGEVTPFEQWDEVVERIGEIYPSSGAAFSGSHAYFSGKYILVDAKEIAFALLRDAGKRKKIREIIFDVTGRQYNLGPYKGEKVAEKNESEQSPIGSLVKRAEESGIEVAYE